MVLNKTKMLFQWIIDVALIVMMQYYATCQNHTKYGIGEWFIKLITIMKVKFSSKGIFSGKPFHHY